MCMGQGQGPGAGPRGRVAEWECAQREGAEMHLLFLTEAGKISRAEPVTDALDAVPTVHVEIVLWDADGKTFALERHSDGRAWLPQERLPAERLSCRRRKRCQLARSGT